MIILNPGSYISTDKWRLGNLYLEYDDIHDPLRFTIDTILKEAKEESRLVKQILYSMLSAYTNYPINLAINSPSDEGKTYVLQKVGELFPKQDAMFLAGMTEKALFHRAGEDQPRTDSKQAPEPEVLTMTDSRQQQCFKFIEPERSNENLQLFLWLSNGTRCSLV